MILGILNNNNMFILFSFLKVLLTLKNGAICDWEFHFIAIIVIKTSWWKGRVVGGAIYIFNLFIINTINFVLVDECASIGIMFLLFTYFIIIAYDTYM